nr:hypothetical protein [Psychrobacter sp. JCM 18900]
MSEKKPKSTAKNTSKKPASGKVTKPLRRASAAKSGQTSSKPDKAASNRKAKLFGRIKKSDTQGAYTSVKNRKSKMVFFEQSVRCFCSWWFRTRQKPFSYGLGSSASHISAID